VGKVSHYQLLKSEWGKRHVKATKLLEEKHKEAFDYILEKLPAKDKLASAVTSLILLSSNLAPTTVLAEMTKAQPVIQEDSSNRLNLLLSDLKFVVPDRMRTLSPDEEASVSAVLSRHFGMDVRPDIGGLRLNRTYGMIGAEQHLMRHPGDNMGSHFTSVSDSDLFYSSGMAPGRGAWGYFANSASEMSITDIEREKWYIAVQTFEAPDYLGRLREYRDFFKYRKMLVVNSSTGQAVVTDIGDAGPAVWTGKHLGGSPEVMYFLGYSEGMRKGPVLYFFINDPNDKISLGPVNFR
jgi:hypothetical protein